PRCARLALDWCGRCPESHLHNPHRDGRKRGPRWIRFDQEPREAWRKYDWRCVATYGSCSKAPRVVEGGRPESQESRNLVEPRPAGPPEIPGGDGGRGPKAGRSPAIVRSDGGGERARIGVRLHPPRAA